MFMAILGVIIFMFILSSHPLFMILILIFSAILNSFLILKIQMLYWVPIMIILGFVGGMMILFLYSTSLAPNEKFNVGMVTLILSGTLLLFVSKPMMSNMSESMKNININEMYSVQFGMILFMLILILIVLNFVMKIIFDPLISLKSSFYEKSN